MKTQFINFVCRPYCTFFREGEKEEMYCQGGIVAFFLVQKNIIRPENLPQYSNVDLNTNKHNAILKKEICNSCPFLIDGCDFRSGNPPFDAVPCGGYIFLSHALDQTEITEDQLREASRGRT